MKLFYESLPLHALDTVGWSLQCPKSAPLSVKEEEEEEEEAVASGGEPTTEGDGNCAPRSGEKRAGNGGQSTIYT